MRITYDNDVDAMYIQFSNAKKVKQQEINDDIILDLADDGSIAGMEILDATGNYGKDILEFSFSLLGEPIKKELYEYTTEEAAKVLQVNKETVLRKIRGGDLKATRIGKSYRIPKSELNKLMTP